MEAVYSRPLSNRQQKRLDINSMLAGKCHGQIPFFVIACLVAVTPLICDVYFLLNKDNVPSIVRNQWTVVELT